MGALEGKVAVITGGTRGLGLAIARAYLREGAAVVAASRSAEAVTATVAQLQTPTARIAGIACDVGDLAQVQALKAYALATFGGLDIWINNAGIAGPYGATAHIAPDMFTAVLQTNIVGTYNGSWAAMQHFLPRHQGKLINILGAGARRPMPMQNAYTSSKGWMKNFTLTLAQEYRESGVGVYTFNPGMMITDLLTRIEAVAGYENRLKSFDAVIRMFGKPPEIPAEKVVWLGSHATDGKTGLLVEQSTVFSLLGGVLKELWRRLRGHPAPPLDLNIHTIPAALVEAPA
ncbi:MAG TPA: SDR family oxidoreductase [Anaerolineae bacterium]|nr:SDR family oxidoreductase [Anaerolineae bacterium]HQI85882.1 SDR family oxidoreductase [Anaerolineae bacterium]